MIAPRFLLRLPLLSVLLLAPVAFDSPSAAGERVPAGLQQAGIEQFMKIRAPNSPVLAPDGTLYVRDWPDGINQLYRRDADAGLDAPLQRLTDFEDGLSSYALSPDGQHLILSAASGGSEQNDLHHLEVATGTITPLMSDPAVVFNFQVWLPDSSGFLFTANEASRSDFHVERFDLEGRQRSKLLDREGYWYAADVTEDAGRILVGQYFSASHADAYELDAATGQLTRLNASDAAAYNAPLGYLPGEGAAALVSDHEEGIRRVFVRDLEKGSVVKPLADLDPYEFEGWASNQQRSHVAITCNEEGYATLRVYTLPDFEPVELPEIDRGLVGSVRLQQNQLVWTLDNARTPGLAYRWKIGEEAEARQLTTAEDQGIPLDEFTLPELIRFESFDGLSVPAFLYLPPGYQPGTAIPFVANYHGGPESQFRPRFSALNQYLLSRGFGILQPNVRGSTGYGREYHMLDNYKNRWDSVRDGVEAVRWLIKEGYAKEGHVAAYGGSYGGFMSVATIIEGQELYGASVNVVGIVNFVTFLQQTKDYRRTLREAEYGPLSDPEFLASISPIHRIDEIRVPMLIAHGLNDPRVPVGEAMQLAVGLQRRGYDPELLFFPDEGHGFAKLDNRLVFAERMVRFLEKHIGERP